MSFEDILESERTKAALPRPAFEPKWSNQLWTFVESVSVAEMRLLDAPHAHMLSREPGKK